MIINYRSTPTRHRSLARSLLTRCLAIYLIAILPHVWAGPPAWWNQRGATSSNPADDYAAANIGQLKWMAIKATTELNTNLPGGAGATLNNLVTNWQSPAPSPTPAPGVTPAPGSTRDDYAALTVGQLKYVAVLFYDRLIHEGYANAYPWTGSVTPPDDYAIANLGQIKQVFAFVVTDPPPAPTSLNATAGNAQVNLVWSVVPGASVTYSIKRATVSGGPYTVIASGLPLPKYFNSNLNNGTTYYYVVNAVRGGLSGPISVQASARPTSPPTVPTGVTALSGNAAITLNWSPVSGATQYVVKRSTTSGSGYTGFTGNTTRIPNLTNTQLTNGTTYYYIVAARNDSGTSDYSNEVAAAPSASPTGGSNNGVPAAPTNFRATRISATKVRYEWDDNSNNETAFIVTDQNGVEIARVGPGVTSVEVDE